MSVTIDAGKCNGCESCVEGCPVSAITVDGGKAKVDDDTCVDCGACAGTCPSEAISQ
ncbi:4Fe-4S ferredoxin [Synergistales bacterium]|nr:4Fe-4S ferredoxin [Synergistales bacterium]GHV55573.1 4Fe-4S ferredoxin [Synergistales bacterium]